MNVDSLEVMSQGDIVLHRGNCNLGQTKTDKGIGVLLENRSHLRSGTFSDSADIWEFKEMMNKEQGLRNADFIHADCVKNKRLCLF